MIREEQICWLRLAGCTYYATTADHVIAVSVRPDLCMVRANLRGACDSCNRHRNNKPIGRLSSVVEHNFSAYGRLNPAGTAYWSDSSTVYCW